MEMILNPDKAFVMLMKQGIKDNDGYCPCKIQMNKDTICPCKEFREENKCECKLYVTK